MISLFMILPLIHVWIAFLEFLINALRLTLFLTLKKFHFMVHEGIVLGHLVSSRGIKVNKVQIDVITSLPYPISMREVCSFLGYARFYRRFTQDFSKIALPLSKLL